MPFDPSSLSRVMLWLRAKDLGSGGAAVSTWPDQSGAGNHGTAAGTTPTVADASTPSGGKSVRYGGGGLHDVINNMSQVSATASSEFSGAFSARLAVDRVTGSAWASASMPAWLKVSNLHDVATGYTITPRSADYPTAWTLQGSNDGGATWDTLDTRSGVSWTANTAQTFSFSNSTVYSQIRLNITGSTTTIVQIDEFRLNTADFGPYDGLELWVVVKSDAGSPGSAWYWSGGETAYGPASIAEDFGLAAVRTFTPTMTTAAWRLYRVRASGTSWQAWLDNVSQSTTTITAPNQIIRTRLGADSNSFWSGNIAEVLVRGAASSAGEVADLITYFNNEHGMTVPGGSSAGTTGTVSVSASAPTVSVACDVTGVTSGSVAAVAAAPSVSVAGNVAGVTSGSVSATAPAPTVTVDGDVPSLVTGAVTAVAPAPTLRVLDLISDEAEGYADSGTDVAGPVAVALDTAEAYAGAGADIDGPVDFEVDHIDAYAEAWADAYDTLEVTLDPDTLRPQYRLKVVDHAGNTICELADAQIGTATRSLNGRGGLDFSLGKNDPQLASVPQFAEVQLWRGAHLVPGGWFTVVDPQIDEGGDTFDYQCSGLTYYFERRLIGAERPEMLRNGGFEEGSRFWSGGWSPGSNAETPPTFEITSDALEGGKALRIFAADKVASIKRTVESAAVFVPNRATFLSGGEQAIRDQVSDIPNGTHITVEGHTADADGGDGYALSVARAEAAAAVIHAYKPTLVIATVGKGETEPVDPRHTEAAYKKNRRVVILANVVQTKVGHRQFEHQSFAASQPASAREPLEFDIQGQGRIDTFEGPSKDGWMLYADVRKAGDPKHLILNNDHVDVDESTARQAWMGLNLTVKVPADGLDYVVDVRLYPTAGSSSFDQISAKPNLKLAFWDADPRHIIGGLVEHAQDGTLGKSDLNIQPYGPRSGFTTSRSWEWKEAKPVSEAIDDMVRSLNGPDANIAVTPRRRWLVIHPKQGRDSGFVLAAGDCAGDARIIGYAAGVDGDNVTTQARVQTSWSGGGMVEQFVTLPRADGLTLENVYRADQDTPSSALLEQGRTAVKYGQADVVTRVAMHPDDTTLLMERVTIGDIVTLAIKDGRVDVNSPYRIIQIDLDPNTDHLAYVVAPEV